jgi:hypothetical protein
MASPARLCGAYRERSVGTGSRIIFCCWTPRRRPDCWWGPGMRTPVPCGSRQPRAAVARVDETTHDEPPPRPALHCGGVTVTAPHCVVCTAACRAQSQAVPPSHDVGRELLRFRRAIRLAAFRGQLPAGGGPRACPTLLWRGNVRAVQGLACGRRAPPPAPLARPSIEQILSYSDKVAFFRLAPLSSDLSLSA